MNKLTTQEQPPAPLSNVWFIHKFARYINKHIKPRKISVTPKMTAALILTFYISTVILSILLAFQLTGDPRYFSPSGAFSIRLPGEWATLSVSFPDDDFSLFPLFLPNSEGDQLTLLSANWKYYEERPILVSVRQIPKEEADTLLGKDSGLKELWTYLEQYQLSSPIAPVMSTLSSMEPDCVHPDLSAISDMAAFIYILQLISPSFNYVPTVTETRYYTMNQWSGPYIIQISAMADAHSYYIVVANGESDYMDISPEELKEAVSTISRSKGGPYDN